MSKISERFSTLSKTLREQLPPSSSRMFDQLVTVRPTGSRTRGFADVGAEAVSALAEAARLPKASILSRAAIAELASDVDRRMERVALTDHVRGKNREWQERLLHFLTSEAGDDYVFPAGDLVKDYRFVHAMSVYFGSQVVDLKEGIGPKTAAKFALKDPGLAVRTYFGTSLRFHVDSRWLVDFDVEGWTRFYVDVADLLEADPGRAGMISTSWFFDPALADVSPRLSYLIDIPRSGGAKIVRHKSTDFDVASATATSPTRRARYEAGEYAPVAYTFVWERSDLLKWAEERRETDTAVSRSFV